MLTIIKDRPYESHSTEDEIQAIRDRVELYGSDCIVLHQIPVPSEFSLEIMFNRVDELSMNIQKYYLIIDLVETHRPNAAIRVKIKEQFQKRMKNIKYAVAYTEMNLLLNIAATFVFSFMFEKGNFSVVKSFQDALNEIEKAKKV
ncbi:MAG: hypothetical protein IIA45_11950 [Bacteroidetes bacterium]|nr:hypothetical protein [Bacteroidota bacterium]